MSEGREREHERDSGGGGGGGGGGGDGGDDVSDGEAAPLPIAAADSDDEARGFTDAELAACLKVIHSFEHRADAFRKPRYKSLRVAAYVMLELLGDKKYFHGQNPTLYQREKSKRRASQMRRERKKADLRGDQAFINKTKMRQDRIDALNQLCLPPELQPKLIEAPPTEFHEENDESVARFRRRCYICKCSYFQVHHFYADLCPECAALSLEKRTQTADCTGRVALVTGGRIKIGYLCVLQLLRAGATVITTSRFPKDAALRFAQEPDFEQFRDRLTIYGIDFRDIRAVERFCDHLLSKLSRLDIIINNAAQTVRRPPAFYRHLLDRETADLPADVADVVPDAAQDFHRSDRLPPMLAAAPLAEAREFAESKGIVEEMDDDERAGAGDGHGAGEHAASHRGPAPEVHDVSAPDAQPTRLPPTHERARRASAQPADESAAADEPVAKHTTTVASTVSRPPPGLSSSALLSQVPLVPGDETHDQAEFPTGLVDTHAQQIDLRRQNTWRTRMHEVSTVEAVECHAVNSIAPFVINARLKPLMMRTLGVDKFIVNVSAMEGKFYRFKTVFHPHTNMAKASLNMMTRTAAEDYAQDRIYMNAVDTGWVTEENPHPVAQRKANENFQPPIDEVDAMARVLDPVFVGIKTGRPVFGKFLKDYRETEW